MVGIKWNQNLWSKFLKNCVISGKKSLIGLTLENGLNIT